MQTHTLFTAFAIAQARFPAAVKIPAKLERRPTDDTTLLNALRTAPDDGLDKYDDALLVCTD